MKDQLDKSVHTAIAGELSLLEEEIKVSCTQGILMCLNEQSRLIYILGSSRQYGLYRLVLTLDYLALKLVGIIDRELDGVPTFCEIFHSKCLYLN